MPQAKRSTSNGTSTKVVGTITAEFEQDRETKNAFRFAEIVAKGQDRGVIGSIYVLKSELEAKGIDPEGILEVTVRQAEED
jgi:SOS response regulatory protein OraA/RecX